MVSEKLIKYIVTETTGLHDKVAATYEALMDKENKEAVKLLDSIAETTRMIKKDLLNKED